MTRLRRQLAPLIPALAAVFALALAAPRPGLVRHAHHGGDHVHAHARPAAHSGPAGNDARHDARRQPLRGFSRAVAADATHVHAQHRYDFAVAPALTRVTVSLALASLTPAAPHAPALRAGNTPHARGPPAARCI